MEVAFSDHFADLIIIVDGGSLLDSGHGASSSSNVGGD